MAEALWVPSPERVAGTAMAALRARVGVPDLHRWSVEDPTAFWDLVWDDAGVVGDRGTAPALAADGSWFADARLSYAENLLAGAPDGVAVVEVAEDGTTREVTGGQLRDEVAAAAAALRHDGIGPGDRVAAWMPNVRETLVLALAANAVGAVFTSSSPDFGPDAVSDRFAQVAPVVLLTAPAYRYGGTVHDRSDALAEVVGRLPSLRRVLATGDPSARGGGTVAWDDWLAPHRGSALHITRLPFDHPGFVLYSSGTTGMPKCIVHRAAGVLLMHRKEHRYHCDVRPGDRVLYFTTCGWMMWNWLVSALAGGASVVLFDGNPAHPGPERLFDEVDRLGVTLLGVSAKYLDTTRRAGIRPVASHDLGTLRTVCSTGSPLGEEGFRYVYEGVKPDVHLASISGGTDLCGCFVLGDPTRPVHAGQLQGPGLGMAVDVLDDDGSPCPPGRTGELVCRPTFPSVPLAFWGDDGTRLRAAYFERFDGWWHHGDRAEWTTEGGMVIHGRSDATLNAGGVRIGTAEITRVVDRLPEIAESMAVAQQWDGDSRVVLLVVPAAGAAVDSHVEDRIRQALRTQASPRHVPARIVVVPDLPRTRNGKLSELAATDAVNGRPPRNAAALADPAVLDVLAGAPALQT